MERVNMKFITDATGMQIQQISFDKGAPRYGALAGGQVDALFEQPGDVRKFMDAGKFKPILTLLKERPAAFADVPSLTDAGLEFRTIVPLPRFLRAQGRSGRPRQVVAMGFPESLLPAQLPEVQREQVHDADRKLS